MTDFHEGQVIYHERFGTGRVINVGQEKIIANFVKAGIKQFDESTAIAELSLFPIDEETEEKSLDTNSIVDAIRGILQEEGLVGLTKIGEKWEGGELILKSGKPGLKDKSIPIEVFFNKIVMLRDRLRVLEQHINASEKLTGSDKLDLQQYITRCYGTLTSFNVLFASREDWFVGDKKENL